MKYIKAWLAVVGLLAAFILIAPAPAQAVPYCGITWGSLAKTAGSASNATVANVRAGQHACFDRLVVDLKGQANGYTVEYVTEVVRPGSGVAVPVRGAADLKITVKAPAYTSSGAASYTPANRNELVNTAGYATFRQVALAGSFEGTTTLALGVRARLPFTAFVLNGPGNTSRIIIDVAHRW
ncbi:AMIN-like domain-containing (lipo)protein [Arthrobacter psychrochitiniphilus]|uniref:AMIN-like domain-containing (lipo)protein n=1 Tax=Arthrobacter psychrochitiniphilus TaxID=291045 RepID=UPI003F7B3977